MPSDPTSFGGTGATEGQLLSTAALLAVAGSPGVADRRQHNRSNADSVSSTHDENEWEVERDKFAEWLSLVLATFVLRFRPYMDGFTVLWLAAYSSGVLAQAALRKKHRALYLRLRPYTAAAFRAACLGLGCASLLKLRMLEDGLQAVPPTSTQDESAWVSAVQLLRIVFTSGCSTMLLFAFSWQTWLSLSLVAQLILAGTTAVYTPSLCTALVAAHPSIQRELHWMHQLLSGAALLVPLPVPPLRAPLPPAAVPQAECGALLTYMQLCGCLLPLAYQAVREARLIARKQLQRAAAGLPPQQGLPAAAQQWLWQVSGGGSSTRLALACFVLMAVTWNCVQLFEY